MDTPPPLNLGALLRRARRAAGLTQEQLAERAGLSVDLISKVEREVTRVPQPYTLDQLASALQLEASERAQWELAVRGKRLPDDGPLAPPTSAGGAAPSWVRPLAAPIVRRPLPAAPNALIGREQEVRAVCAQLQRPAGRLLTLTGSAGVGKTRLALAVAEEVGAAFADGVQFVSLAALADPAQVLPTIGQALGLHDMGNQSVQALLETALHTQQVLLVLDNFEQVISAAPFLAELLAACPHLKLLVTSREALHLRAEQQFIVPPLALPAPLSRTAPQQHAQATLGETPAVQLFVQRAQAAHPAFHLTPSNEATIAEICIRLDGLPLALELAAPRLKLLSPQALLSRLDGRLQVLGEGARDLPERQRTMQATIHWSYDLLSSAEQALFRRLAVFVGGWTLEAAEQVCVAAGALDLDMLEGLAALLDKSLLRQNQAAEGETRFRMLYVLREFGLERLEAEKELAATREAHAASYLALAEEAEPQLRGAAQQAWLDRLEQEHDNLRAALQWWLERAEQAAEPQAAERALRLGNALSLFWMSRNYFREGLGFFERGLALRAGVAAELQVLVLLCAATLLIAVDEVERGEALTQEALALARQGGDTENIAFALATLGWSVEYRDQYTQARGYLEEAAVLLQQEGRAWYRGVCLMQLADIALIQGDYERAQTLMEESLVIYQAIGDQQRVGMVLGYLGWTHLVSQGDLARAAALVEQGLALLREVGATWNSAVALLQLGEIRRQQGKLDEAHILMEEGLAICQESGAPAIIFVTQNALARLLMQQGNLAAAKALYEGNRAFLPTSGYQYLIAGYLEGWGTLKAAMGRPGTAAQLWGTAEALREAIGAPMAPVYRDEQTQAVAAARAQLGEVAFAAAWTEGRGRTPEQVLASED